MKVDGGWQLNGRKVWTSWAHRFHLMVTLVRTSPPSENRYAGMSQFLLDLSSPGLTTKPIISIDGEHHFNQVIFDDLFVPDEMLIGEVGNGWNQVIGELAFERSGPERFLSTFPILLAFVRRIVADPDRAARVALGQLVARLWTLRRMSLAVASLLEQGKFPNVESALVKDLGTQYEQSLAEIIRLLTLVRPSLQSEDPLEAWLAQALLRGPSFTLRGGQMKSCAGLWPEAWVYDEPSKRNAEPDYPNCSQTLWRSRDTDCFRRSRAGDVANSPLGSCRRDRVPSRFNSGENRWCWR